MKSLVALLLSTLTAFAPIVVVVNPFRGTFGGGIAYFFSERFENPTGYDKTWTESGGGTKDEDYATSPAPLEGAQSLRIAASVTGPKTVTVFSSDQGELWLFCKIRFIVMPTAAKSMVIIQDSTPTTLGTFRVETDGTVSALNGTTADPSPSVTAMTTGNTYNVWMHWKQGGGANGITTVGFDTGTTEITSGNNFSNTSSGNSIGNAHQLQVGFSSNTTCEFIIDQILISTTGTIGNNPQ